MKAKKLTRDIIDGERSRAKSYNSNQIFILQSYSDKLVIIKNLVRVIEDGVNHTDLPSRVLNVRTRIGTH